MICTFLGKDCFKTFFFSLIFRNLILTCLGIDFFDFPRIWVLTASWLCRLMFFLKFENFDYYFNIIYDSLSLFFWQFYGMYDYCYSFTGSWSYVYLLFIFSFSLSFRLFKFRWSILSKLFFLLLLTLQCWTYPTHLKIYDIVSSF